MRVNNIFIFYLNKTAVAVAAIEVKLNKRYVF